MSISNTAKITESQVSQTARIFERANVSKSVIGDGVMIGDDATVVSSTVADKVSLNRRNYIFRSDIGKFTYTGIDTTIRSARVGAFCSFAWNVSIGGGNHKLDSVTTSPLWRFRVLECGDLNHSENADLRKRWEEMERCEVGNDVWIATNAVILNSATVGNGAVIGAGAVVTKDVAPYSIVAGVPAKKIGMRFDETTIQALEEIQWWNWETEVIRDNIDLIYATKVDEGVLDRLREVAAGLK